VENTSVRSSLHLLPSVSHQIVGFPYSGVTVLSRSYAASARFVEIFYVTAVLYLGQQMHFNP